MDKKIIDENSKSVNVPLLRFRVSPIYAAVALLLWGILTFGHGIGTKIASTLYDLARHSDLFYPGGGVAGFARFELFLTLVFIAIAAGIIIPLAWSFRRVQPRLMAEVAVPWLLWAVLFFLIWKFFIIFATEFVHFAQYALIGAFVALAIEHGRRPQLAFLIAIILGFLDEVWQHYGLHMWWMKDYLHWMDWSDPMLNALGASGGILPFVTVQKLRGDVPPSEFQLIRRGFIVAAVLFLPLLFLDPVLTSQILGHYPYYPFWDEWHNFKPVHWLMPREGIPLCLSAIVIIGLLLDPRKHQLSVGWIAVLIFLGVIAVRPESRLTGREVHEVVATVQAPWIPANAIKIDGILDERIWQKAPRLGPFINMRDGRPGLTLYKDDTRSIVSLKETHARLLWDDKALYLAFEVKDEDIWARNLERDDLGLQGDEGVKIFLDDGGDEITYYQFVINPLNKVYDALDFIGAAPMDYRYVSLPEWNATSLRTAVKVQGTLDVVPKWKEAPAQDQDEGYVVEVAIPWESLRTSNQPKPGERWRLGLYRTERPRSKFSPKEAHGTVSASEARRIIGIEEKKFVKLIEDKKLKPSQKEGNRFPFEIVKRFAAIQRAEHQAWTPTYSGPEKSEFFGVIEFIKEGG